MKKSKSGDVFAVGVDTIQASQQDTITHLRQVIADLQSSTDQSGIHLISMDLIDASPYQCRIYFNQQEQDELTASIEEYGQLTPVILRAIDDRFQMVAGERRLIAAKRLNRPAIEAKILHNISDQIAAELVLVENLKRGAISPIEEVRSVLSLLKTVGLSGFEDTEKIASGLKWIKIASSSSKKMEVGLTEEQEALLKEAKALIERTTTNKWDSFLANRLPLIDLPIFLQDRMIEGLQYTKAKLIAKISKTLGEDEGIRIAQKTLDENLSLAEIRSYMPETKAKLKDKENTNTTNSSHSFELISRQLSDIDSFWLSDITFHKEEAQALEKLLDSLKSRIKWEEKERTASNG
jgi:ParB family transcriptional regulator, chromosome partitioning protein